MSCTGILERRKWLSWRVFGSFNRLGVLRGDFSGSVRMTLEELRRAFVNLLVAVSGFHGWILLQFNRVL